MPRRSLDSLTLALVAAVLLWAAPARAQELVLRNLVIDNQAGNITVRIGVGIDEVEEVSEGLMEGAVLGLDCRAELTRDRSFWTDAVEARGAYLSRVSYDALSKEYVLKAPGLKQPLRGTDLQPLLVRGWGEIAMDLGSWKILERGKRYRLELSISLERLDVPGWLKSALFFWPWDAAPSMQYSVDFLY
jgi:hypothetical protein